MFKHNSKTRIRDAEQNRAFAFCVAEPRSARHAVTPKRCLYIRSQASYGLKLKSLRTAGASHLLLNEQCDIHP